jgi:hypothetical protein
MFEPGDKVRIIEDEDNKVWTVLGYPYKVWHEQAVVVGDAEGHEKAVTVNELAKVEEPAGKPGFRCNGDFCEIVREEMRPE